MKQSWRATTRPDNGVSGDSTDTGVFEFGIGVTAGRGRDRPPDTVSGPTPAGQVSPCSAQVSRIRRRFRSAVATDRPSLAAISAFV